MLSDAEVPIDVDEIKLSDPAFWVRPTAEREAAFAALRRQRPISFHEEPRHPGMPEGPGYWALTKYDDIVFASRHPELFESGQGVAIGDLPPELDAMLGFMANTDAPQHTQLRLLVNKSFTPRMVARIEEMILAEAASIVAAIAPRGACDFVVDVATPLPLRVICELMGVPREDSPFILEQSNHLAGGLDPEYNKTLDDMLQGGWRMWEYAQHLGAERLATPRDDITSLLMHAEVDGRRLTAAEFGAFFVLLCTAGNETTRNAISHGFVQFSRNPDQRHRLQAGDPASLALAVEEVVRWATPVMHFRRTTAAPVELPSGRHRFETGEKVVLWYNSANRDEEFWQDPYRFDVTRHPNEHVGFGGGGPHFCLGANLARAEIRAMLHELYRVLPDIEAVDEPDLLHSSFLHGIKHVTASFTPR